MRDINSWEEYDLVNRQMDAENPMPGLEYFEPKQFSLNYDIFKVSHLGANRIIKIGDKLQLPTNSILHLFDSMMTPDEVRDTPQWETNPYIRHESSRRAMCHVRQLLLAPYGTSETFRFPIMHLMTNLLKFRTQYPREFLYPSSFDNIPESSRVLNIINHNPTWRVILRNPKLIYHRKLVLTYTSLLNHAVVLAEQFPTKRQFITIPWGEEIYGKEQFLRARTVLDTNSVKHPNSYHYLMMMEFLNYLWPKCTLSMFHLIDKDILSKITFIIGNDKYNIFLTLPTLLKFPDRNVTIYRLVNQLNQLSLLCRETSDNAEKLSRIVEEVESPDSVVKSALVNNDIISGVKEILTKSSIVNQTSGITAEDKTEAVIAQAAKEIPVKREELQATPEKHEESEGTSIAPATPPSLSSSQVNAATRRNISRKTEVQQYNKATTQTAVTTAATTDSSSREFNKEADLRMYQFIHSRNELTPKQKDRLYRIGMSYRNILLDDGMTVGQLLDRDDNIQVNTEVIGDNVVGKRPIDESLRNSSIPEFDRKYIRQIFRKQLVSILASFRSNGLFLTDIKTEHVVNPVNDDTYYSCKFVDYRGKSSTVKFRIPNINRYGRFKLDGVESVMLKQRLNNPIVKISDVEVSMSSNYNKARVLRNTTIAHSFYSYIDRLVNSNKTHACVVYGNASVNHVPVAYEYSTLCDKYESIEFHDNDRIKWSLYFNYPKRFQHYGGTEKELAELEKSYGVYLGRSDTHLLFINRDNYVTGYSVNRGEDPQFKYHTIAEICKLALNPGESYKKILTEWVVFKNLDINLPVIFVLAYRHGLRHILDEMKIEYTITEGRTKTIIGENDKSPMAGTESFFDVTNSTVNELKHIVDQLKDVRYGVWNERSNSPVYSLRNDSVTNQDDIRVLTPKECLRYRVGTCWEQAMVIAEYCQVRQIPYHFCYVDMTDGHTHTFVVAQTDSGWFYLETAWQSNKGVHGPYSSVEEAVLDFKHQMRDENPRILFLTTRINIDVTPFFDDKHITAEKFLIRMGSAVGLAKYREFRSKGMDVTHVKVNGVFEANPNFATNDLAGMESFSSTDLMDNPQGYLVLETSDGYRPGLERVSSSVEPDYSRAVDQICALLAKYQNENDDKAVKVAHALSRNRFFMRVLGAPGYQRRAISWYELWQDLSVDMHCAPTDYAYESIFLVLGAFLTAHVNNELQNFNCYFMCRQKTFVLDKVNADQVLPSTAPAVVQIPHEDFYPGKASFDEYGILDNGGKYLYHLSLKDLGRDVDMMPRNPRIAADEMENNSVKRVCVSTSIFGCTAAISYKLLAASDKPRTPYVGVTVYAIPINQVNPAKYVSSEELKSNYDIYDVDVTNEAWILEPVKMHRIGQILVDISLPLSVFHRNSRTPSQQRPQDKMQVAYMYGYKWVQGRDPQFPNRTDFPIYECVDKYRHIPDINASIERGTFLDKLIARAKSVLGFGNDFYYCLALNPREGEDPYFVPMDQESGSYFTAYADLSAAVSDMSLLGKRYVYVVREDKLRDCEKLKGGNSGSINLVHVFKPVKFHYAGEINVTSKGFVWTKKHVDEFTTDSHQECDADFTFSRDPVDISGTPLELQQLYGVSEYINYGILNAATKRAIAPNSSVEYIVKNQMVSPPKRILKRGGIGTDWETTMVIAYLSRKKAHYCSVCAIACAEGVVRVFPVVNIRDQWYHVEPMFMGDTGIHGPFKSVDEAVSRAVYRTKKLNKTTIFAVRKNVDVSPFFTKEGIITRAEFLKAFALDTRYYERAVEADVAHVATEDLKNDISEQYIRLNIVPYQEDEYRVVATLYTLSDRGRHTSWDELFDNGISTSVLKTTVPTYQEWGRLTRQLINAANELVAKHPAARTYVFVDTQQLMEYPRQDNLGSTPISQVAFSLLYLESAFSDMNEHLVCEDIARACHEAAAHYDSEDVVLVNNVFFRYNWLQQGENYDSINHQENYDRYQSVLNHLVITEKLEEWNAWLKPQQLELVIDHSDILLRSTADVNPTVLLDDSISLVVPGHTNLAVIDTRLDVGMEAAAEGIKYQPRPGDIPIKFEDRILWINRYPLEKSLVVAGLEAFDLTQYKLADFEDKEIYYRILSDMGKSLNYLKGIDSFFDLFIDPITYNVLKEMGEPTTPEGLLYRSAQLLSTRDHRPAASSVNYRIRGYEQFNAIIFNELARAAHKWQTNKSRSNVFSVNPNAIYLKIATNSAVLSTDAANPLQDIRLSSYMTFAGTGGRSAESFVLEDRRYVKDDIGIMALDTSDNQKVGMNAMLPMNSQILNTNGTLRITDGEGLKPADVLAFHSLLFPCSVHDDFKRVNKLI